LLATLALLAMPTAGAEGGFLTGLGFQGWGWLVPVLVPLAIMMVAFGATRFAAFRMLRSLT
jgi:cell division transport system permease protein